MNQNERKRSNVTHSQQQQLMSNFFYYVHNQAGFDIPFINGRDFSYLGISKMSFTF